jgi:uncharacterized membrane protein YjgN (DUF898 family)
MPGSIQKLRYDGTGGQLLGLFLVNALLTVVTFGVYSFWARARIRRFFYAHTDLAGDRFAFHGTGMEMLKGWLIGIAVVIGLGMVFSISLTAMGALTPGAPPSGAQIALMLGYFAVLTCLIGIAINGARRYRLSRSSWRGIRFGFTGKWQDFLKVIVPGVLLTVITLGIYGPFFRNNSRAFLVNHARFGSLRFKYDGSGKDLIGNYLVSLLLAVPTLGLILVWYRAREYRYFWSRTTVGPARFRSTVTGGGLLLTGLTNVLLVLVTLGIGIPWAVTRWMTYLCDSLELEGNIAWKEIEQQAQFSSSIAEGLAQGLDVNVDLGLGM